MRHWHTDQWNKVARRVAGVNKYYAFHYNKTRLTGPKIASIAIFASYFCLATGKGEIIVNCRAVVQSWDGYIFLFLLSVFFVLQYGVRCFILKSRLVHLAACGLVSYIPLPLILSCQVLYFPAHVFLVCILDSTLACSSGWLHTRGIYSKFRAWVKVSCSQVFVRAILKCVVSAWLVDHFWYLSQSLLIWNHKYQTR